MEKSKHPSLAHPFKFEIGSLLKEKDNVYTGSQHLLYVRPDPKSEYETLYQMQVWPQPGRVWTVVEQDSKYVRIVSAPLGRDIKVRNGWIERRFLPPSRGGQFIIVKEA